MPSLMQQLHDIEGIDAISPWPLAIGWWIVIACAVLMLASGAWMLRRHLAYLRSWKRDTFMRLDSLEQNLSPDTSWEAMTFLSEYLRRIVMRRFPRNECAGLVGDAWLKWLREHDPQQFDWTDKGKLLIQIPYAPVRTDLPVQQVKELIQAARNWVC
ncbi:MAG: DUF4381 domain-containing protein [Chlamydiales bacterium]|nr:DUF4381 domain-containing protein [Chlamydiales bacterium]